MTEGSGEGTFVERSLLLPETPEDIKLRNAFNDIKEKKYGIPYDTGKELFNQRSSLCVLYKASFHDPKYIEKHINETKKEMEKIAVYYGKTIEQMEKEINKEFGIGEKNEEEAKENMMSMWKSLIKKETRLPTYKES